MNDKKISRRSFLRFAIYGTVAVAVAPSLFKPTKSKILTAAEKEKIIGDLLKTSAGRMKLARAMQQPIRTRLDYKGIFRKVCVVERI